MGWPLKTFHLFFCFAFMELYEVILEGNGVHRKREIFTIDINIIKLYNFTLRVCVIIKHSSVF